MVWLAVRCLANTSAGSVSSATVPCGPPPCTTATRRGATALPEGATTPSMATAATKPIKEPPHAQRRRTSASMPTPIAAMPSVNSTGPPSRAMGANGASACVSEAIDKGTPPNGAW